MAPPRQPRQMSACAASHRPSRRRRAAVVALALGLSASVGPANALPVGAACGSFQALVDAAPSGATITIPACTYHEIVSIHKPITINAPGVVVDGDNIRNLGVAVLANDVTINGLTVTHVKSDSHVGAVWTTGVSRFTFRGGVARDSATVCISLNGGTGHRVLDSELSGCGKEGYFMNGVSDTLFAGNRIHDNNAALASDPGAEAGGGKTMASQRVTFDGNDVAHNRGAGIWFDNGVVDATATNNRVHDNDRAGIFFEISNGARISGNAVWNNGFGFVAWGYGAGITVSSSDRADVHDNTVAWNARGISVISQNRELQPHNGNVVHNNVIVASSGAFVTGFYDDHGGSLFDSSNANSGYGNRYWVGAAEPSTDRFGWAGPRTRLADYNGTPGDEGAAYLTTAERDTALQAAGIPGSDGTPPAPAPTTSPSPGTSPAPSISPNPGTTPAPTTPPGPGLSPAPATPATAPTPGFAFRAGQMSSNASVPGRISWVASEGVKAYQLQSQRDGGRWISVAPTSVGSRSGSLLYEGSSRYRARLRVQSETGAWSPWAYSTSIATARYQETSAPISYSGSWTRKTSLGASGVYVRYASMVGATASFSFTGRAVTWVAPRGPSRGSARIYIDGVYRTTVSLYRSSTLARSIVFFASWPARGSHTVTIKVVGTTGHPRVDVDAFAVLG